MSASAPIIVVGAGIGGLAAALLLARAGWPVTLVERRAALEQEGAGLQLSPNASRVLIEAGLGKAARMSIRLTRAHPPSPSRRMVATSPPSRSDRTRLSVTAVPISSSTARTSPRCFSTRSGPSRASAWFWETKPARCETKGMGSRSRWREARARARRSQASAVVAASGLWSTFRIGQAAPAHYSGYTAWRALLTSRAAPEFARANEVGLWLAPSAHLVHYPIRRGEAVNIVAVLPEPRSLEGWSRPGDAEAMHPAFADWAGPARDLVAATRELAVLVALRPPTEANLGNRSRHAARRRGASNATFPRPGSRDGDRGRRRAGGRADAFHRRQRPLRISWRPYAAMNRRAARERHACSVKRAATRSSITPPGRSPLRATSFSPLCRGNACSRATTGSMAGTHHGTIRRPPSQAPRFRTGDAPLRVRHDPM